MFLFKTIESLGLKYLYDMLASCEPAKPLRSCGTDSLVIPRSSPIKHMLHSYMKYSNAIMISKWTEIFFFFHMPFSSLVSQHYLFNSYKALLNTRCVCFCLNCPCFLLLFVFINLLFSCGCKVHNTMCFFQHCFHPGWNGVCEWGFALLI